MARWLNSAFTLMILLFAMPSVGDGDASSLLTRWRSSRVLEPMSVTDSEIRQIELLFARSLDRPMEAPTLRAWAELGFVTESLRLNGDPCQLLFEASDSQQGRGMFLLCPTRSRASTLLIPHGFHDRFTAEIGALFAVEGRFRAIAWNTTARRTTEDDPSQIASHEVVRPVDSYFTSLARAAAVLGLPGPMIELHGFAPYRRSTEAGRSARAILSSGTNIPHASTLEVSYCLERTLGDRLFVYPTEISELGGTQNQVAAVLRAWGRRDFLHLELSFALRTRLLEDAQARRSVVECVGGAAE